MKIVGITPENRYVVDDIFKFYSTYGIPIDFICEWLLKRDLIPDWESFIGDSLKSGMNPKSVEIQIKHAIEWIKLLDNSNK